MDRDTMGNAVSREADIRRAVDGRELRRVLLGVGLLPKPTGAVSLSDYAPTR